MDSNLVRIEIPKIDDIIDLEVFSDEHFGDPKRDKILCEKRQSAVLDNPLRFTAFGGDMFNNIMPWDKRWSLESSEYNSLTQEVKAWEEFHEPLFEEHKRMLNKTTKYSKGMPKIWYGLAGNHEYMDKHIDHYWMKNLFGDQEIKYLGSRGWVGLEVTHKGKPLRRWKIFAAHGFGGSKAVEKPLQDMKKNNYADVFIMGHLHRKYATSEIVYDFNFSEGKYVKKEIVLGNTGTFTHSIIDGMDSWFEHRNESIHSAPGTITISFNAYTGKMTSHVG